MPETNNKTKTIIKAFPFKLDDAEKLERGQRLAAEVQEVYDARETAKTAAADHKKAIEGHESTVRNLREVVATGVEWRDVECEERFYRASGEVCTVRLDTGAVVDVRPMTPSERQVSFDEYGEK